MKRLLSLRDRWTAKVRALTFEDAARLLPVATGLAAGVSIGLVAYKRWLLALFNLAIATFLVFPAAIARWRSEPAAELEPSVQLPDGSKGRRHWFSAAVGQIAIVVFCWYLAGPPWHLERHHRPTEWHEHLHFGPLQAISKGYLPFIGPAATPFIGPSLDDPEARAFLESHPGTVKVERRLGNATVPILLSQT